MSATVTKLQYPAGMLLPSQARAARAILGWKQTDLAQESGLKVQAIKLFEAGKTDPRASTVAAIEQAFDRHGVVFLDAGENRDGGPGLRIKR